MRRAAGLTTICLLAATATACRSGAVPAASASHHPRPATKTETPPPEPSPAYSNDVRNLPVTAAVRRQLVAAFAKKNHLPTRDYTGLAPGLTYYGYDRGAKTYWAAGRPEPRKGSLRAQVSLQDEGGYSLFWRPAGEGWQIEMVGETGPYQRGCSWMPPSLDAAWGWQPGGCRPTSVPG